VHGPGSIQELIFPGIMPTPQSGVSMRTAPLVALFDGLLVGEV
jgi:hypothetical protein